MLALLTNTPEPNTLLETHSGELTVLVLGALVVGTLWVLVPQMLRHRHQSLELLHAERLKALEVGRPIPPPDVRSIMAGRTSTLVPMTAVIAAGTVTCFLAAYRAESVFSVALAVWSVAGVISLAAVTGGVALLGRLAQIESGELFEEPELPGEPPDEPRDQGPRLRE